MSYVDDLLAAYRKFVALPWQQNLAPRSGCDDRSTGVHHHRPEPSLGRISIVAASPGRRPSARRQPSAWRG